MVTDLSSLLTSIRNAAKIGLACSQTPYFLFKVRRERVGGGGGGFLTPRAGGGGGGGGGLIDPQRKGVVSPQAYSL